MPSDIEALCLEIEHSACKNVTVICAYRPPDSDDEFFTSFENVINRLDHDDKELIILGDLNCDLLTSRREHHTKQLLNISEEFQLHQLIHEPTRITEKSATLLDVIYTNNPDRILNSGVIHCGISDHSLIYVIRKTSLRLRLGKHKYVTNRNFKNFDADAFNEDLKNLSWHEILSMKDANTMWTKWKTLFLTVLERHAPHKMRRVKHKQMPWMSAELKKLINEKHKMKARANKSSNPNDWEQFKKLRNLINNRLKEAKATYYKSQIKSNAENPRAVWKIINQLMNRNETSNVINKIAIGDRESTDSKDIAEILNTHFTSIGQKLADQIQSSTSHFADYIVPTEATFELKEVDHEYVLKLIKKLDVSKATGLDTISSKLLKIAAPVICDSLSAIFNKSITTGIFPDELKYAKVFPVHKKGSKCDVNNYRPISVLPVIAKIFERIIYNQLISFLDSNNLLSNAQSGFRSLHSTVTALLDATNDWYANLDNGHLNSVAYLDLTKAFDTVDHEILLKKLELYGISNTSLQWFKSYLSEREQCCYVNNSLSPPAKIPCGVPQGSILGPLLFLIYINDLPNCLEFTTARMFADDTNLTAAGKNVQEIQCKLNSDLSNTKTWLDANKLSLNVAKTEFMLIGTDYRLANLGFPCKIKMDSLEVKRVNTAKSLGVCIDERLSWESHVDLLAKKVSSAIAGLRQVRPFVNRDTLSLIYKTLIQPHFDYCDVVWDNLSIGLTTRLQKLQNRAGRVILRANYDTRSEDVLKILQWDNLEQRRFKHKATLMYKILNNNAPKYLTDSFHTIEDSNPYKLRNRSNLRLPLPKSEMMKRSFKYSGPKLWNSLSPNLKSAQSVTSFKRQLNSSCPLPKHQ